MLDFVLDRSTKKRTTSGKELPDTRVLNLFKELCIMRAAAENSFGRVLNPHGGAYIYIEREKERE